MKNQYAICHGVDVNQAHGNDSLKRDMPNLNQKNMHRLLVALFLFVVGLQWSYCEPADSISMQKEILYITSYNVDHRYSTSFIEDMMEEYRNLGGKFKVSIEALNCSSYESHSQWVGTMQQIIENHPHADLVVLYGLEAWGCFFALPDPRYREIPLICVASARYAGMQTQRKREVVDFLELQKSFNVKGFYYYDYDIAKDMDFLAKFFPEVEKLAIISDNSYAGLSTRNVLTRYLEDFHPQLAVTYIDGMDLDMEEASAAVEKLDNKTAIFFCVWKFDKTGSVKTEYDHRIFHLQTDEKEIPVISLTGSGFGSWAIGGCHPSYSWDDGRVKPSEIAYRFLDQQEDVEPYFFKVPNHLRMDKNVLDRFKISRSELPKETFIINDDSLTFVQVWDDYKWTIVVSVLAFILLVISLAVSITYAIHLKRVRASYLDAKVRAEHADRMKGTFIQNISHEIRTPLNAIQGFSQLVLDDDMDLDRETKQAMFTEIERSVKVVTDQIDEILQLSSIEGHPTPGKPEEVSMTEVLDIAMVTARTYIPPTVKVNIKLVEDMVVHTVKSDVVTILAHLLSNAGKFTKKGEILVQVFQDLDHRRLTVSVTDDGPGIPVNESERIFDSFYKLDSFVPGTGLGLTISRMLARRLGGNLYLDIAYLRGSRFVLTLPLTE